MKINDLRKNIWVKVSEIPIGGAFMYEGNLCVRVKVNLTGIKPDEYFDIDIVDLTRSIFNRLRGDVKVVPVYTEINIT